MVRTYLLRDEERQEMVGYMRNPTSMSGKLRQARLLSKQIDFKQLRADIDLIERFAAMVVPRGRVSRELKSRFRVRIPGERSRTKLGRWRKKRSDAGKPRKKKEENLVEK